MGLNTLIANILYGVVWLFSLLPFRVLYVISNFLAFLMDKVIRYRREVILDNLRRSFPEKSEHEISRIKRKFYKHLSDVVVESIKLLHISEEEIDRRCHFTVGTHKLVHSYYSKGQSFITLLGHYGNWEWIPPSFYIHHPIEIAPVYRPLRSKPFDYLLKRIRGKFSNNLIPKNQVARNVVRLQKQETPTIYGFIADQAPSGQDMYWVQFLKQDTAVYSGPEKIARTFKLPVVFAVLRKKSRGKFIVHAELICEDPGQLAEGMITNRFMQKMEREIRREPAHWLWSHRRWKTLRQGALKRVDFGAIYPRE